MIGDGCRSPEKLRLQHRILGQMAYLDAMVAEPFENFNFSPAGAAVYQLGPFGTAAKKLKTWDLMP